MAARLFTPTLYPLVDLDKDSPNYGLVTSQWRRYQEAVTTALVPGALNEVLTSDGANFNWKKLTNANIDAAAAITYTKLTLSASIVNADIANAAAIAYSKLNLATSIVNADVSAAAAIAYSKLNLTTAIVNGDIAAAAAIAWSKISKTSSSLADLATRSWSDVTGLASSTYTPTLTGVANVAASTAYVCQYLQVGTTVTVSGKLDVDPTAGATLTQIGISLPVASALTLPEQVGGTAMAPVANYFGGIYGDAANDRAQLDFTTVADVANRSWTFTFTYRVI